MNLQRVILGCILIDQGIQDLAIPKLNLAHFSESNRWLADLLKRMYSRGEPIDIVTVSRKIDETSPLQISDISNMSTVAPSDSRNILDYIYLLRDEYLRTWIHAQMGISLSVSDDPLEYISDYVNKLENLKSETYHEGRDLISIIDDAYKPEAPGISTRITKLNKIDPLKPGRLIIVGGRPSHGKTQFAMDIARTTCEQGKSVLVFSLEMIDTELVRRYMKSSPVDEIGMWNMRILDRAGVGIDYIISNSRIAKPDLIVVDYLGLIKLPPDRRTKQEKIGDITKALKCLAKELNCPIILIVQASRQIESRTAKIHQMDDLADSAEIERDADFVSFVMRYDLWGITEYNDGTSTDDSVVLQIVKNRHGMVDTIRMKLQDFIFTDFHELPF